MGRVPFTLPLPRSKTATSGSEVVQQTREPNGCPKGIQGCVRMESQTRSHLY